MLTKVDVKHIAHLARLGLTDQEIEKYTTQLSSILEYVEQLQQVNTDGVEPTAQVTGLENVMRADVIEKFNKADREQMIKLAPETEDNLIKTKSVFE